jgi:hypothetical protein
MEYLFDEPAKAMSRSKLTDQLPRLIYDAADSDIAPTLERIFGLRCNDTPVVRELLEEVLLSLRKEGVSVVDEVGRVKPRANNIEWSDRVLLSPHPQRSFFGPFSKLKLNN